MQPATRSSASQWLTEKLHCSAGPVEQRGASATEASESKSGGRGTGHETTSHGDRALLVSPGVLKEPVPQGFVVFGTRERRQEQVLLLTVPQLGGGDSSLDSATVSFLVEAAVLARAELDKKKTEEEKKVVQAKEAELKKTLAESAPIADHETCTTHTHHLQPEGF